jgi:tRNA pseudouridine13 synthase
MACELSMSQEYPGPDTLAFALGPPVCTAGFKQELADFRVIEDLGFELTGHGEHLCVQVRKAGMTTPELVRMLARIADVREHDIGFAGLKDRQGICTQWFSIYLPLEIELDFSMLSTAGVELLQCVRNSRKIRRGSHRRNLFQIRLRGVDSPAHHAGIERRLEAIAKDGVPNYFGAQRFGYNNSNVASADRLFSGHLRLNRGFKRGMLISAARSFLFNELLSRRVELANWNRYIDGDVMNLSGTDSVFVPESWDGTLEQRLGEGDIHPTGPLWGEGILRSSDDVLALEQELRSSFEVLCLGLETAKVQQARRSLRLTVADLCWQWSGEDDLELMFALPPGTYATAVLRELCILNEARIV